MVTLDKHLEEDVDSLQAEIYGMVGQISGSAFHPNEGLKTVLGRDPIGWHGAALELKQRLESRYNISIVDIKESDLETIHVDDVVNYIRESLRRKQGP